MTKDKSGDPWIDWGGDEEGADEDGFFSAMVGGVTDVALGAQETIRSVVGDVTKVPGSVAAEVAEPAAEVAMAPFTMAVWLGAALIAGAIADEVLTGGNVRKGITG